MPGPEDVSRRSPEKLMATYVQADRPLTVTTPLHRDDLLPIGFHGHEALSRLFEFHLDLVTENKTAVPFEKLLGQKVTLHLTLLSGKKRHFSGICRSLREGTRDATFTSYQMVVVPQLWLLSKRSQSRIFQQKTVPEILRAVLGGLDVLFEIEGTFHPRDYCVQYRESDFAFASRLMEEEGIYYFFKHAENGHALVVANTPFGHPELSEPSRIVFGTSEQGLHGENRISAWEKTQELRSGHYTLWDHCFELPYKHLEAKSSVADQMVVGKVVHKLRVGPTDQLEVYDYPGGYADRFDGVNPAGGDHRADLDHIFEDNGRTTQIRQEEEQAAILEVRGAGTCRHFLSGFKFNLERHFNADGTYLLKSVRHSARTADSYRSGGAPGLIYENTFTCTPIDLPFRPARSTPRPTVHGTQTAVVVGPAGEEIFTDKYGRVKVQFHWDRDGKKDGNSSCWIRVATPWAGKGWGAIHLPRVGQEVVVDFLEGDPDRPLIVGSVYNADQMPPFGLPGSKVISGVKSHSYPGGGGYNEFVLDDTKGNELIRVHGQNDMDSTIENDLREHVRNDRTRDVANNEKIQVGGERTANVGKNQDVTIVGNDSLHVGKVLAIDAGDEITLTTGAASIVMKKDGTIAIKGMNISVEGTAQVGLKVGQSSVSLDPSGVKIGGMLVEAEAQVQAVFKGLMTQINAGAMLQTQGGITMMS